MPARSSELRHPSGLELVTPLLIPSLSSRGFGAEPDGTPTVTAIFRVAREFLADTLLVSAFDLHHGFVPDPGPLVSLMFIDSGGYETSADDDLSAYRISTPATGEWNDRLHREVLASWPAEIPAVFVTYDRYARLEAQIDHGLEQVEQFPKQLHAILLKPEIRGSGTIQPLALGTRVRDLARFDIVGVTEKELGGSVLERVFTLAALRRLLDDVSVPTPIHVFGGLDPLTAILYFVAGAELFDGLTWLRYGFANGVAVYPQNYYALQVPLDASPATARAHMLTTNIAHLQRLRYAMRDYQHTVDPSVFGPHHKLVEQVVRQIALTRR